MAQFLLVLMCGVVVFFAINTIINMTKAASASANTALGENMPKTFQRIAYVVLIMLMFGVVTGWLGAV